MTVREQFRAEIEAVPGGHRFRLSERGNAVSVERYLQLHDDDDAFRHWYTSLLVEKGPDGFFWEHPPFTIDSMNDHVEFVLIQSLFLSSLTSDQVTAYVLGVLVAFFLLFLGHPRVVAVIDGMAPGSLLGSWLETRVSALPHFETFVQGRLELAGLTYFLGLTAVFLWLNAVVLREDRR